MKNIRMSPELRNMWSVITELEKLSTEKDQVMLWKETSGDLVVGMHGKPTEITFLVRENDRLVAAFKRAFETHTYERMTIATDIDAPQCAQYLFSHLCME